MKHKILFIVVFLLFQGSYVLAQNPADIYKQAESIRSLNGEFDNRYIDKLKECIQASGDLEDFSSALKYRNILNDVIKRRFGEKSVEYAEALYKTGNVHYIMQNDFKTALPYYQQSIELYDELSATSDINYLGSLRQGGTCFLELGMEDEFINYRNLELQYYQSINDHKDVAFIYCLIGEGLFLLENYEKSIEYYLLAEEICESFIDDEDCPLDYYSIAVAFANNNQNDLAINYFHKALEHPNTVASEYELLCLYHDIGYIYYISEEFDSAIEYFVQFEDYFNYFKEKNPEILNDQYELLSFCNILHYHSILFEREGKYSQASKLREIVNQYLPLASDSKQDHVRNKLLLFADYYYCDKDTEAYDLGAAIFDDVKEIYSETDLNKYLSFLHMFGGLSCLYQKFDEAGIIYNELISLGKKDGFSKSYADAVLCMIDIMLETNQIDKAYDYYYELEKVIADSQSLNDIDFYRVASIGAIKRYEKDYISASNIYTKALDSPAGVYNEGQILHIKLKLAWCYLNKSSYRSAENLLLEVEDGLTKNGMTNYPEYYECMNNLSIIYRYKGEVAKAQDIFETLKKKAEKGIGVQTSEYLIIMHNSVDDRLSLSDYSNALTEAKQCHEISQELFGEENYQTKLIEFQIVRALYGLERYEEAYSQIKIVTDWIEQGNNHDYRFPLLVYNNLININPKVGRQSEQYEAIQNLVYYSYISIFPEAYSKITKENLTDFLMSIESWVISEGYSKAQIEKAERETVDVVTRMLALFRDADINDDVNEDTMNIIRKMIPIFHSFLDDEDDIILKRQDLYKTYVESLAILEAKCKMKDDYLAVKYAANMANNFYTNMAFFTESDRNRYWLNYNNAKDFLLSLRKKDSTNKVIYDFILNTKSILLGTNTELQRIVYNTKDSQLISEYEEIKSLKNQTDISLSAKDIQLDSISQMSLKYKIEAMEREFIHELNNKNISLRRISWSDIKNALKDNESAVEFFSYKPPYSMEERYIAMVVNSTSKNPDYIDLGPVKGIMDTVDPQEYYSSSDLYNWIWKPIKKYIKDGSTVYYSPYGFINRVNLSALPDDKGISIGQTNKMILCSSTKYLVMHNSLKRNSPLDEVSIWGGLIYDGSEEHPGKINMTRSGWEYLPGSYQESQDIASILDKSGITYHLYQGHDGDEQSFISISGTDNTALHISTHGYYNFPDTTSCAKYQYTIDFNDAMMRSGLIMANGNSAWLRENETTFSNDNILTSLEIANLNLSSVNLVVLSACETGLGDISNDGVIGLQRAFKNAGVQTIIMSLWKISDEVSAIIMRDFYSNLAKGMEKRMAFDETITSIRESYPDPYYWAGFVMLD